MVVAEHEAGKVLSAGTLSAITAASKIGGDVSLRFIGPSFASFFRTKQISVLVIGKNVSDAAAHAAKVKNVSKVLVVDHDAFANSLAEDVSKVVQEIAPKYSHILAPSSNSTKNFIPRAAALLDASPLTDVVSVVDDSTFKRPVYAGNAIATVKMSNAHKVFLQLL